MKMLPQIDLEKYEVQPTVGSTGHQVLDDEGTVIAEAPAWVPDNKAHDFFKLVLGHEERGRRAGEKAGASAERERITYGFKVVLAPLCAAISHAAETAAPQR